MMAMTGEGEVQSPGLHPFASPFAVFSEWRLPSKDSHRDAGEAVLGAWDPSSWPEGLVAHHALAGMDGRTVLHLSQWTGAHAVRSIDEDLHPVRVGEDTAGVPQLEKVRVDQFRPYRGRRYAPAGQPERSSLIIVPRFRTGGHERAEAWIDAMLATTGADHAGEPIEGLLATHFFIDTSGDHALLFAEWTDAGANQRFREKRSRADDLLKSHRVERAGAGAFQYRGGRMNRMP